jgi:guanylate kinase
MSEENQILSKSSEQPLLMILSGLSGAGKDAVLNRLKQSGFPPVSVTTVTTRARRANERDGEHYHFISDERFREMVAGDELLEHATVYGNSYGVPREAVRQALDNDRDVIIKVDVQGALTIKKKVPGAIFIFLTPASLDELAARLRERRTESPEDLELRLKTAKAELEKLSLFDYLVINRHGEVSRAVADIEAIYRAEKRRVKPRDISL